MMDIFIELGLIIAIGIIITVITWILRQPLILGYIFTGIIVGPNLLGILRSTEVLGVFSQVGIALLLFIVGLGLTPRVVKEVGKVSVITGVGQVIFTSAIGFLISKSLGFSTITSIYIAIALTFSSTIIIMKLLSDKGDTSTLYGRIAIGFLIVQDIIAMIILMVVSSSRQGFNLGVIFENFAIGVGLVVALFLLGIYALPKITNIIAKSQEFLLLFSVGWCLILAALFHYLGFSMEIGALLAGITLASSPYKYEISAKMKPLRDFFIVLFFILLGAQIGFANLGTYAIPIILFSIFVLIGNPLIVMVLMGLLGYTRRNSFLAGLTVAQISEFSIILVALGIKMGHLTNEILFIITTVALITIAGSSYVILYADKIYPYLSNYLKIFERKGQKVDAHKYHSSDKYDIILFGCDRIGYDLLKSLKKLRTKFLVIDYNPDTIVNLAKEGIECRYGDAEDVELLNELNFSDAKMIISTIADFDTNCFLITKIMEINRNAVVIVVAHQIDEAIELYKKGASYVIMPHFLGGKHAATLIERCGYNLNVFLMERYRHIQELLHRKKIGHEHPKTKLF